MLGRKDRDRLELVLARSSARVDPRRSRLGSGGFRPRLVVASRGVKDCDCLDDGRPGIDPEIAVRLMLAGFLLGIVHDSEVMREAQVNLAIRLFADLGLTEPIPDHSSLTRIGQRWGAGTLPAPSNR
jgi:hypothetical protein